MCLGILTCPLVRLVSSAEVFNDLSLPFNLFFKFHLATDCIKVALKMFSGTRIQFEILWPIVLAVVVDMVNTLVLFENSSEFFFHDQSMLHHISTRVCPWVMWPV